MRLDRRKLAQVGLIWEGRLGPSGFRRLIAHFGGPPEALEATAEQLSAPGLRLEAEQVAAIVRLRDRLGAVEEQLEALHDARIAVFCDYDEGYPAILRELESAPPVLSVAGRLMPFDDPAVAIVGTRTPTDGGVGMARELGRAFAARECTVVSGLALGCDTGAHVGALAGGGRTIAVLGGGIRAIQPRENLELAREIAERGAIISELAPMAEPTTARLMARNRLTSGLARGVIVVQAAAEGGAMRTAELAERQGRLVYAVQWPTSGGRTVGNEKLLREGAAPIMGAADAAAVCEALFVNKQEQRRRRAEPPQQLGLFG
jgi:DNA processing protein